MKELPLRTRIVNYFKNHPDVWFHKGDLCELGGQAGYLQDNVSRRLREIENTGFIQSQIRKNHNTGRSSTWYRYTPRTYQEKLF